MAKQSPKRTTKRPAANSRKPIELVGVVHPLGGGGSRGGRDTLWTFVFSFVAWREPGGPVEERRLWLNKPGLTDAQLDELSGSIRGYDILRVRLAKAPAEGDNGRLQAQITEIVGPQADAELAARVEELREPVTVDDPTFGTFTLDRGLNWYECEAAWNGETVRLFLSRDGCDDEAELFDTARKLWKAQKGWDRKLRDLAAKELLGLKNDGWLGEREKKFTAARFKARMTPESVKVSPGGQFEFCFNDGNLFWGHVILVTGSLADGPTDATIAG